MTGRRVHVGSHVRITAETPEGISLEGMVRLRPGQTIELVMPGQDGATPTTRVASVTSWAIVRLGHDGPTYAGRCAWV
jgi:hypothetical protein